MEPPAAKQAKATGVTSLDVSQVSAPFRAEIREKVKQLWATKQIKPLLVGLLAHGDASAKKYADWTSRACQADGIAFDLRECQPEDLENELNLANEDPKVHGIMIYYPCFGAQPSFYGGSMDDYLRDTVCVEKDVEGLCSTYRRNLYSNVRNLPWLDGSSTDIKCLLPCTPLAIVKILEHLQVYNAEKPVGDRLSGTRITVVNRSEIVGRPLAAMLANDGATVMSVDIDSVYEMQRGKMLRAKPEDATLERCVQHSSVVILGVPTKDFKLNCDWLRRENNQRVIVVNVSHFKNIDEDALYAANPNAVYVPLVGQVTVAMLERNLLRLIDSFVGQKIKVVEAGGRVVRL